ncbi:MAG TPA: hypothetical protein PKK95_05905 [Vicinamibacterales bacterium]|nr:hypothetical protein [Acidobacteriota bacterium]HOC17780.1 hypothetical protein [Vicinamibacterales bacterium]
MRSLVVAGGALALLLALPAEGRAQGLLRGLTDAAVTVSHDWTEADAQCGIREADIKPLAAKAAADTGLKVADDSPHAELLVTFVTLETEGTCVSHVRVALRGWATTTLLYDDKKEPRAMQVVLREESTLLLSPARLHGERFRERVRGLAERIAKAVEEENR